VRLGSMYQLTKRCCCGVLRRRRRARGEGQYCCAQEDSAKRHRRPVPLQPPKAGHCDCAAVRLATASTRQPYTDGAMRLRWLRRNWPVAAPTRVRGTGSFGLVRGPSARPLLGVLLGGVDESPACDTLSGSVALIAADRGPQLLRRQDDGSTWVRFGWFAGRRVAAREDAHAIRTMEATRRPSLAGKRPGVGHSAFAPPTC